MLWFKKSNFKNDKCKNYFKNYFKFVLKKIYKNEIGDSLFFKNRHKMRLRKYYFKQIQLTYWPLETNLLLHKGLDTKITNYFLS